jgi:hypothetical protein
MKRKRTVFIVGVLLVMAAHLHHDGFRNAGTARVGPKDR